MTAETRAEITGLRSQIRVLKKQAKLSMNDLTLQYPVKIAAEIGLHVNEINSFKGKGCRFFGRKTCVAWVREYLHKVTATELPSERFERLQRLIENTHDEPVAKND